MTTEKKKLTEPEKLTQERTELRAENRAIEKAIELVQRQKTANEMRIQKINARLKALQ